MLKMLLDPMGGIVMTNDGKKTLLLCIPLLSGVFLSY